MNTEQLKQLKPGDEIFIRARYKKELDDGDVLYTHSARMNYDEVFETNGFSHPENVILPSELQPAPKYDPCRKFQSGDVVEPSKCQGREAWGMNQEETTVLLPIGRYTVLHESCSQVEIQAANGDIFFIASCFLKLVTPVEELEPYFTKEDREELWWEVWKRDEEVGGLLVALFSTGEHPNSKAAAEAECARLNEEYRKEQSNG